MNTHNINLKLLASIVMVGLLISGCSSIKNTFGKRDNGSLDYRNSQLLDPIQIPVEKQTQLFTPLYPTVRAGKSPIKVTNESGKQYQLPEPQRTVK